MDEGKRYKIAIFKPVDHSEFRYCFFLPILHSSCIRSQGLDRDPGMANFLA